LRDDRRHRAGGGGALRSRDAVRRDHAARIAGLDPATGERRSAQPVPADGARGEGAARAAHQPGIHRARRPEEAGQRMTWLLRLYPRPWRDRYADEVAEILATHAFSFATAIDLIAGALDVWLHPGLTMAAANAAAHSTGKETTMLTRILRFDC